MNIKTMMPVRSYRLWKLNVLLIFYTNILVNIEIVKAPLKKSLLYAIKEISGLGGLVFVFETENEVLGVLVVNKTGMNEYITEIFRYISL